MIEWSSNLNKNVKKNINFVDLVQKPFLKITIFILLIFIFYNMVSCGIIIILPFLLGGANKSFYEMFLAYLVEIPAIFFVLLLFEN